MKLRKGFIRKVSFTVDHNPHTKSVEITCESSNRIGGNLRRKTVEFLCKNNVLSVFRLDLLIADPPKDDFVNEEQMVDSKGKRMVNVKKKLKILKIN